jgi:hypothetical protein
MKRKGARGEVEGTNYRLLFAFSISSFCFLDLIE